MGILYRMMELGQTISPLTKDALSVSKSLRGLESLKRVELEMKVHHTWTPGAILSSRASRTTKNRGGSSSRHLKDVINPQGHFISADEAEWTRSEELLIALHLFRAKDWIGAEGQHGRRGSRTDHRGLGRTEGEPGEDGTMISDCSPMR
jgi:hypothetical protein